MRPLRLKSTATPVDSSNFQGVQEMTDAEIEQYISAVLSTKLATDYNGTLTSELNMSTDDSNVGDSVGTFTDTRRTEAIGTHPATGAISSTTYYVKQVSSAATENITNRLCGYDDTTNIGVNEFNDSALDTDVLDKVIGDMVSESTYTAGLYSLSAGTPSGGTWTSRFSLTNTTEAGANSNTSYIWQQTTPSSSAVSTHKPVKIENTADLKEMSQSEIEQMVPNLRNRIMSTGIGTYKLQSTAPVTGTWTQMGDAAGFSDTRQQVLDQAYAGTYNQGYTGAYSQTYTGVYTAAYSGGYTATYSGSYTGAYTRTYTGNYTGAYSINPTYTGSYTRAYAGAYTGAFTGTYILYYAGVVYGYFSGAYAQAFTGNYNRAWTGGYVGTVTYTGIYAGSYNQAYSGAYVGNYNRVYTGAYNQGYSGNYDGIYSGVYTSAYSGSYSGATVLGSTDTVSTVKLWLRTA